MHGVGSSLRGTQSGKLAESLWQGIRPGDRLVTPMKTLGLLILSSADQSGRREKSGSVSTTLVFMFCRPECFGTAPQRA